MVQRNQDRNSQNIRGQNIEHMVDSYEIYGEKEPDESEIDEQEEIVHSRKRTGSNKVNASRKGRSYRTD